MKSLSPLILLAGFFICCSYAHYNIGQRGQEVLRDSTHLLGEALHQLERILHLA